MNPPAAQLLIPAAIRRTPADKSRRGGWPGRADSLKDLGARRIAFAALGRIAAAAIGGASCFDVAAAGGNRGGVLILEEATPPPAILFGRPPNSSAAWGA